MKRHSWSDHIVLIIGVLFMVTPIWLTFASSTHNPNTIMSEGLQWGLGDNLVGIYQEA